MSIDLLHWALATAFVFVWLVVAYFMRDNVASKKKEQPPDEIGSTLIQ